MGSEDQIACLICTKYKGVLLGFIHPSETRATTVEAFNVRFCVFWSVPMKGVLGLAVFGPDKDCKIGPVVSSAILHEVTAIFRVTETALKAWNKAPWKE